MPYTKILNGTHYFFPINPLSLKKQKKNKKNPPKTKQTKYKTFSPPPGEGRNMGHGWEQ